MFLLTPNDDRTCNIRILHEKKFIRHLQLIQNAAACVPTKTRTIEHITPCSSENRL